MAMEKVTTADFDKKVLNNDLPVILDFGAPWCGPCKTLEPMMESIVEGYKDQVFLAHVDVGDDPELAAKYGVLGVPTLIFMNKGTIIKQLSGVPGKSKIIDAIEDVIAAGS